MQLVPGGVEREQDGPGLVDLVQAPGAGERPARVLPLEPEAFGRLRRDEPAETGAGEVLPPAGQEAEDREREVARPDESVAAGLDEVRIHLRGGDHAAGVPVGDEVEDEQRAPVDGLEPVGGRRECGTDPLAVVAEPLLEQRLEAGCERVVEPGERLVGSRPEREHDRRLVAFAGKRRFDVAVGDGAAVEPAVLEVLEHGVGLAADGAAAGELVRPVERDRDHSAAPVDDERVAVKVGVDRLAVRRLVEPGAQVDRQPVRAPSPEPAREQGLPGADDVGDLRVEAAPGGAGAQHGRVVHVLLPPR